MLDSIAVATKYHFGTEPNPISTQPICKHVQLRDGIVVPAATKYMISSRTISANMTCQALAIDLSGFVLRPAKLFVLEMTNDVVKKIGRTKKTW